MAADPTTLAFYTAEARAYAEHVDLALAKDQLEEFAAGIPRGGDILDFGCGSGWAGAHFKQHGFRVRGLDGSKALAAIARERHALDVTVGPFESFSASAEFDGIWASFCLLHDSRSAFPGHLRRIRTALRPGGVLYLGLKEGSGTRRDALGRLYTYFSAPEIGDRLGETGFGTPSIKAEMSEGYDGSTELCLHIMARRD